MQAAMLYCPCYNYLCKNKLYTKEIMDIKTQLLEDMKQAMKAKDMDTLGVIRFLRSEIKNFEIDNGDQDDAGVQKIIASQVKKLKDAVTDFQKAGRTDLVDAELGKISVMEKYLPEQLSDADLEKIVSEVLESVEETNVGKLIGLVMQKVAGRADGGRVSALIRSKLQ